MVGFGDPIGHQQGYWRPAVVVSADRLNASRAELVIVVPLTRTRRGLTSHIEVQPGSSGLTETSYAMTEDVKSVSTKRLTRHLGRADLATLVQVGRTLSWLLELP